MNIEIVIPVFRPDGRLKMSIERLLRQSVMPDRILLEVLYENPIDREIPEIYMDKRIEVRYTPKEEYDRAGSRDAIIRELDSDIVIFMVQMAIPQNRYLVEKLTEPFKEERTAVVYGRHMTDDECSPIECCVRQFNYPPKGMKKSLEDTRKLGIRHFSILMHAQRTEEVRIWRQKALEEDDRRRGHARGEKTSGKGLADGLCARG